MGYLSINPDVRVVGAPLAPGPALPEANGVPTYERPFLDRIGDLVRDSTWLPVGGGLLGGVAAGVLSARAGHGLLGKGASVLGGLLLGSVTAIGAGLGIDALGGDPEVETGRPVADTRVKADEDLRVMTYNLHGAQGPAGEHFTSDEELDRLAESIRRDKPDVVLLQELDRFATRSNYTETLAELASRLGATGAVFTPRGTMVTGRQEGTGVLTFNGITVTDARGLNSADPVGSDILRRAGTAVTGGIRQFRNEVLGHDVPDDGTPEYFPRVTTDAMLVTPAGNHIRVLSGHYNGPHATVPYQQIQVDPVAELADDWQGPTIWGGDWNVRSLTRSGQRERDLLQRAGLTDTFIEAGMEPGDRARGGDIDRIYGSGHFDVGSVSVSPFDPDEPDPSDHHPVVAEMRLRVDGGSGE